MLTKKPEGVAQIAPHLAVDEHEAVDRFCVGMAEPITPTRVQFHEEFPEPSKPRPKQQPTQKYDRKEIQKRLDIESWMDEQLRDLYECDVSPNA